jgi:hypothetical protein
MGLPVMRNAVAAILMLLTATSAAWSTQDAIKQAKASVSTLIGARASDSGFSDVRHVPGAVCGWVHVRDNGRENGRRPFVFIIATHETHVLDLPAYPNGVQAAAGAIGRYCSAKTRR